MDSPDRVYPLQTAAQRCAEHKRKEEKKMKLDKLLEDILWEIEAAGKDCPESLRQFEEKIKKAIYI